LKHLSGKQWQRVANASQRGRSNQRKVGLHERKIFKTLSELMDLTFERNLEQRRYADHFGDLLCTDAKFPLVIEVKYHSKGNGILAGASLAIFKPFYLSSPAYFNLSSIILILPQMRRDSSA
tara:strand:+ start:1310 stop:1675 length:366 start_codon:yes stop_codon:yes gene_type:complete